MATDRSMRRTWPYGVSGRLAPHARLAGLAVLVAGPVALVVTSVPHPFVMPTLAFVAFSVAAVTWLTAWGLDAARPRDDVTLWDAAGALVLIGCAAAMFSEADVFLKTMDHRPEQ